MAAMQVSRALSSMFRAGARTAGRTAQAGCVRRASSATAPVASQSNVAASALGSVEFTHQSVADYYGKVLQSSKDLKTSACTASGPPPAQLTEAINKVPRGVTDKFYGCGTPLPLGVEGLSMLDLGSGSGRDAYVAAALVGPSGSVTGVDMTDEQLETARAHVDVSDVWGVGARAGGDAGLQARVVGAARAPTRAHPRTHARAPS